MFYIQEDYWPLNTTLYVKDFHGNDPLFVSYLLRTIDFHSHSGKSGVPGVNRNDLHELLVTIPPTKAEQEAIAEALSDADALIESLEQLIAKKRHIKQGIMQELLTGKSRLPGFGGEWKTRRLGEFIAHCSSGATPYRGRPEFYKGDIKWITSGELNYNVVTDTLEKISKEAVEKTNLKLHPVGTFLMAITGLEAAGTRGACGIVGSPSTTNQSCMAIYPTPELSTGYLYHYYVYRGNELALKYCQGTKQQSYTTKLVRILPISLPMSIEEQTAIASILCDMDAEIAALESRLTKAHQLKHGIMHNLLTGKIRLVPQASTIIPFPKAKESEGKPAKPHNWEINEAVVISVLVKQFGSEQYPLGRKRYTKLSYLLHRHVERQAEGYLKKAAGPYNPDTKYKGPEGIAQKNGYIRYHKRDQYKGFIAGKAISKAEDYFSKWYGNEVLAWLEQFRRKSNDELELLATVDMAMEDLRRAGQSMHVGSVTRIIQNHPEWEAKLQRDVFSNANISRALQICQEMFA